MLRYVDALIESVQRTTRKLRPGSGGVSTAAEDTFVGPAAADDEEEEDEEEDRVDSRRLTFGRCEDDDEEVDDDWESDRDDGERGMSSSAV